MSWTNECCESNYFKVKDGVENEVREVLEQMGFAVDRNIEDNTICFYSTGEGTWFDDNVEVVMSLKPIETNNEEKRYLLGVLSDYADYVLEDILEKHNLTNDDVIVQSIIEFLEDSLEVGYGIVITTAGFESRSSGDSNPFGDILVIGKTENKSFNKFMSLWAFARQVADENGLKI